MICCMASAPWLFFSVRLHSDRRWKTHGSHDSAFGMVSTDRTVKSFLDTGITTHVIYMSLLTSEQNEQASIDSLIEVKAHMIASQPQEAQVGHP